MTNGFVSGLFVSLRSHQLVQIGPISPSSATVTDWSINSELLPISNVHLGIYTLEDNTRSMTKIYYDLRISYKKCEKNKLFHDTVCTRGISKIWHIFHQWTIWPRKLKLDRKLHLIINLATQILVQNYL